METAAKHYAATVAAATAQRARLQDGPAEEWSSGIARRMSMDPRRAPTTNFAALAALVEPADVVVDVGGGAGRLALPLALRCKEVINVDPAPAMGAEFERVAQEAGITNARLLPRSWQAAQADGDVVLTANVTYFLDDIVPFVEKMARAARRRVIISVWSVPPPDQDGVLFELIYGEPQAGHAGYQELLPVLWEMGILPDVRVLPDGFREGKLPQSREEAIAWAALRVRAEVERARAAIEAHFDRLFRATERGMMPRWRPEARELLITWQTGTGA